MGAEKTPNVCLGQKITSVYRCRASAIENPLGIFVWNISSKLSCSWAHSTLCSSLNLGILAWWVWVFSSSSAANVRVLGNVGLAQESLCRLSLPHRQYTESLAPWYNGIGDEKESCVHSFCHGHNKEQANIKDMQQNIKNANFFHPPPPHSPPFLIANILNTYTVCETPGHFLFTFEGETSF